ncbi:MAG: class II aldolase/adducin family protein [Caldilineae bacterium]|nr:MAG: class II aldolase/adducin family protein [Caldilineae bacterium]
MTEPLIRYAKAEPETRQKSEEELRREIVQVCHLLAQKGLVAALDGNVSARLGEDRFLCTPSGFNKGMIEPDQLLVVDWDVQPVGPGTEANRRLRPSSEMLLHLEAYQQRPDISAVVHAHPPTAVALSIVGISLAHCLVPDAVVGLGMIPMTAYATPSSREGAEVIRELIRRWDALVLQRHGSVTVGNSPLEAYWRLEKLEQVAQMTKMAYELGDPQPLPAEEIAKLVAWRRAQGLIRPGQEQDRCSICGVSHFATTG